MSEEFPFAGSEFVEERNANLAVDSIMQSAVGGIQLLIAPAAGAGVMDGVGRVAVKIGITRIDFAEIGEQRD